MLIINFFVKKKDWGRGRRRGGLINFPPLKRGVLLERGAYLRGEGLNRGFTVLEILCMLL